MTHQSSLHFYKTSQPFLLYSFAAYRSHAMKRRVFPVIMKNFQVIYIYYLENPTNFSLFFFQCVLLFIKALLLPPHGATGSGWVRTVARATPCARQTTESTESVCYSISGSRSSWKPKHGVGRSNFELFPTRLKAHHVI